MSYIIPSPDPDQGYHGAGMPFIVFPRADLSTEDEHERLGPNEATFNKLKLEIAEALDDYLGRQHTFADEFRNMSHKDRVFTLAVMGILEAGPVKGMKLFGGVVLSTGKLYWKDPNMRFFTNRWLNKIKIPAMQRAGWLYAGRTTGRLDKVNAITRNPIYRTLQQGGATIFKGKGWENRLEHLKGFDPQFEIPGEVQKRLKRYLREQVTESGEFDEMPYNRRTGQWYPARRRGGYRSGGYNRGYSSRGRSSYAPRRRRSYRRW